MGAQGSQGGLSDHSRRVLGRMIFRETALKGAFVIEPELKEDDPAFGVRWAEAGTRIIADRDQNWLLLESSPRRAIQGGTDNVGSGKLQAKG